MLIHQPSPNKPKTMPLPWTQISQTIVLCVLECKCMNPVGAACTPRGKYVQRPCKNVHPRCGWVYDPSFAKQYEGCRLAWPGTMLAPLGPKMWMVYAGRTAAICCDYINMHRRGNQAGTLHQLLVLLSLFCRFLLRCYDLLPGCSAFCGVHLNLFQVKRNANSGKLANPMCRT